MRVAVIGKSVLSSDQINAVIFCLEEFHRKTPITELVGTLRKKPKSKLPGPVGAAYGAEVFGKKYRLPRVEIPYRSGKLTLTNHQRGLDIIGSDPVSEHLIFFANGVDKDRVIRLARARGMGITIIDHDTFSRAEASAKDKVTYPYITISLGYHGNLFDGWIKQFHWGKLSTFKHGASAAAAHHFGVAFNKLMKKVKEIESGKTL